MLLTKPGKDNYKIDFIVQIGGGGDEECVGMKKALAPKFIIFLYE